MIDSDALESFHDRLVALDATLAKHKNAEISRSELIDRISSLAKEWLRTSQQLRSSTVVPHVVLDRCDGTMAELLTSTRQRTRASSYRVKLSPLVQSFYDDIVIPTIRFEGSPAQVAARQLQAIFADGLATDELSYIEEAARCAGTHCNRAAIILLWAAAVARMHTAVQKIGFDTYNTVFATVAARKGSPFNRLAKGATISSLPELQRARDFDLLVVGMDLWGYDLQAYEELDRLLGLRNSAAHPGMFHPSALEVQQFAQKAHRFVFKTITT